MFAVWEWSKVNWHQTSPATSRNQPGRRMKAADNYLRITTVCLKVGQELVWLPKLRRFLCKLKHQKAEDVPRFLWPNGCETLCRNLQCCRGQDLGIRGLTSDLFLEHWNDIDAFGRVVGRIALKRCRPSRTSTLGLLRVKVLMLFSLSWALALTSPHCWGSFLLIFLSLHPLCPSIFTSLCLNKEERGRSDAG